MARNPVRPPDPFLPLTPVAFEILLALADGDRHGYAILQAVDAQTAGALRLHPGTLYRALARLADSHLIQELDQQPAGEGDDERRRYFRLTALGHRVAAAEARRLETQLRCARRRRLLPHAGPA
ncbi:MAG TPA: PadR family transcriptional regulator [Gemmatimonadales bacterium]|nr:PadR family transcriptional regulator [Gemmatimonadales bacterium]